MQQPRILIRIPEETYNLHDQTQYFQNWFHWKDQLKFEDISCNRGAHILSKLPWYLGAAPKKAQAGNEQEEVHQQK